MQVLHPRGEHLAGLPGTRVAPELSSAFETLWPSPCPISTTSNMKSSDAAPWSWPSPPRPRPHTLPSSLHQNRVLRCLARQAGVGREERNKLLFYVPVMSFLPPPGGPMAVTSSTSTMSSLFVSFLSNQCPWSIHCRRSSMGGWAPYASLAGMLRSSGEEARATRCQFRGPSALTGRSRRLFPPRESPQPVSHPHSGQGAAHGRFDLQEEVSLVLPL